MAIQKPLFSLIKNDSDEEAVTPPQRDKGTHSDKE
jgi:hypothetical protein